MSGENQNFGYDIRIRCLERTDSFSETKKHQEENWLGIGLEIISEVKMEKLDKIPYYIEFPTDQNTNNMVEKRKLRCYLCGSGNHL